jgi:hypothetical protein
MPALRNARHEAFAQQLVHGQKFGWTRGSCYSRSGYKAEGESAESAAWRLLKNVENGIAARVAEIVGKGAKRAEVTVQSLLEELEAAREGATSAEQFAAVTGAVIAKAKLKGLMVDRLAVGSPSDFAACETVEQVLDKMLGEQTPAEALMQLDELRGLIEQRAANQATIIEQPMTTPQPNNETEMALKTFRPVRKQAR